MGGDDTRAGSIPEQDRVRWELAIDAAGVGAFDWDLETGQVRFDDRLIEIFGFDDFAGTFAEFDAAVHPEDRERVARALDGAIASCSGYTLDYRIVLPGGALRWITARGQALAGPDGTATRVLGAASDSTAQHEGEARVTRVLEAIPTVVFHLSPEWRFTFANAIAQGLLGAVSTDIVGANVWELFPEAVGTDFERHYRGAMQTGEPSTFEAYYPPPLDAWYDVHAWPSTEGLTVYFLEITEQRRAREALERASRRTALMVELGDALSETLDSEEAVARLARVVVPELGDWCIVSLVDGELADRADWRRHLRDAAWWHADPERRPLVERYAAGRIQALTETSYAARAFQDEWVLVVPEGATEAIAAVLAPGEARDACLALAPNSGAVVPLRARGRTVGLLSVFRSAGSAPFAAEEVRALEEAAGRAALALDNTRLYAQQRQLAEILQRSMMSAPPQMPGVQVAVRYVAAAQAAQVGGDWYDSFLQADGSMALVIGDVVGHDSAAAAAMGQIRGLLRGIAVTTGAGPAELLERVDEAMAQLSIDTTATVIAARVDLGAGDGAGILHWASAGHPPALVAEPEARGGGVVRLLARSDPELLLGLDPHASRSESSLPLAPGSIVLLYTDGLVERRGQPLDAGIERLAEVLEVLLSKDLDLEQLCDELLQRMLPAQREDDVALVAVRISSN